MVYKGKAILTALAVLMIVLVLVNIVLSLGNQSLRAEVNERQQFLAQSMQLEGLHREIITVLATVALKTNNDQLKSLLASQGINFGPPPAPAGSAKEHIVENELPTIEELQDQAIAAVEPVEKRGSSLPLILTMVSVLIWFAFQTVQLVFERNNLTAVKAKFESAMQESQKMQSQLQSLVSKTVELAQQGNPAAKAAVEELEKRGIPIKGATAQPTK